MWFYCIFTGFLRIDPCRQFTNSGSATKYNLIKRYQHDSDRPVCVLTIDFAERTVRLLFADSPGQRMYGLFIEYMISPRRTVQNGLYAGNPKLNIYRNNNVQTDGIPAFVYTVSSQQIDNGRMVYEPARKKIRRRRARAGETFGYNVGVSVRVRRRAGGRVFRCFCSPSICFETEYFFVLFLIFGAANGQCIYIYII